MFELAARKKLRFNFKGTISVEDLWDLSLGQLDQLAHSLNEKIASDNKGSFIPTKQVSKTTSEDELRMEIVLHVINVLCIEEDKRKQALANKAKREHLLSLLADKQKEADSDLSKEELEALLQDLEATS